MINIFLQMKTDAIPTHACTVVFVSRAEKPLSNATAQVGTRAPCAKLQMESLRVITSQVRFIIFLCIFPNTIDIFHVYLSNHPENTSLAIHASIEMPFTVRHS